METIVEQKGEGFKELEEKVFRIVCRMGVAITQEVLKAKDEEIFKERDRSKYESKGFRKTSIKTVYGPVEYSRRVYKTTLEGGKVAYIYLLDEAMGMEKIGLMSVNLAEKIADAATEASYRKAAALISDTTGNPVSAQGVWGVIQGLGDRISKEEDAGVKRMNAGCPEGKEVTSVLFEEMDGTWVRQQGSHHEKLPKMEVKVSTTYEGWDADQEARKRSTLVRRHVLAGIEDARTFHEKHEAEIQKRYDADEIELRILNGDGGNWIGDPYDPDVVVQLDPFHVHKEIRRLITDKKAVHDIEDLLSGKDVEGVLSYIQLYADSVASKDPNDKREGNALALYRYLSENKDSLIPWTERGINAPEPPEGILYKGMGVQEAENCSVITMRMKHRRMRWSRQGGNNMAKTLYRRANGELHETIGRYSKELFRPEEVLEAIEVLSAAKAPRKDGEGNPYVDQVRCSVPLLGAALTEGRKAYHDIVSGKGAV